MDERLTHELSSFLDGEGRLKQLPAKYKKKLTALYYLAGRLEAGRQFTEFEINCLLDDLTLFHDPATLRRELFNKRLLNRTDDGSSYRRAEELPPYEEFMKQFI